MTTAQHREKIVINPFFSGAHFMILLRVVVPHDKDQSRVKDSFRLLWSRVAPLIRENKAAKKLEYDYHLADLPHCTAVPCVDTKYDYAVSARIAVVTVVSIVLELRQGATKEVNHTRYADFQDERGPVGTERWRQSKAPSLHADRWLTTCFSLAYVAPEAVGRRKH